MPDDVLDVHLFGRRIGTLRQGADGARFTASPEALDQYGIGSPVLSVALPLEASAASGAATEAFFGGLLPEGPRLDALLRARTGLSRRRLVGLLAAVGRDVAGAIVLPGPEVTALGPLLTADEAAAEVANPSTFVAGGGSVSAGLRPKVAFGRSAKGWHAARDGHPATHLIKPVSPDAKRDAHAEVWTMRLARAAGLIGYDVWLESFGDIPAVVIERFDREPVPGGIRRLHQEDAAQALALPWGGDDKFSWGNPRATYAAIAALLDRDRSVFDHGPGDKERLLQHTVFRLIVGDTDAHAKNHALLHDSDGTVTLAPMYDVTPGVLYGAGAGPALFIDGRRMLHTIDADALVAEARTWGLAEPVAREVVAATAERVRAEARVLPADASIAAHLPGYVTQAATALLEGRPVGLGLGEFPTLRPLDVA